MTAKQQPDPKAPNQETSDALPDPGPRRWWRISHNPRSRTKPIKVELMEAWSGNRRALSRVIGWDQTIADPERVAETAEDVLARVGDYDRVIGEYGGE